MWVADTPCVSESDPPALCHLCSASSLPAQGRVSAQGSSQPCNLQGRGKEAERQTGGRPSSIAWRSNGPRCAQLRILTAEKKQRLVCGSISHVLLRKLNYSPGPGESLRLRLCGTLLGDAPCVAQTALGSLRLQETQRLPCLRPHALALPGQGQSKDPTGGPGWDQAAGAWLRIT